MDAYNFTDRTRRALYAANDVSAQHGHEYVGTEHILLALMQDRDSAAAQLLANLGSNIEGMRATIEGIIGKGDFAAPEGSMRPYTSRAKKVLELAMKCAREDDFSPTGTQHLLLGLIREQKGIAAQVLARDGATEDRAMQALGEVKAGQREAGDHRVLDYGLKRRGVVARYALADLKGFPRPDSIVVTIRATYKVG